MQKIASKQKSFEQTASIDHCPVPLVSFEPTSPEDFMNHVLRIARRLIPLEEVVLVEPLVRQAGPPAAGEKNFKSRIILIDKDTLLCEEAPEDFISRYGFSLIGEDRVAINPAIRFAVELFEAGGEFQPVKAYRTRLLWKDGGGTTHSKLLLAAPEDVVAVAVRGLVFARPSLRRRRLIRPPWRSSNKPM